MDAFSIYVMPPKHIQKITMEREKPCHVSRPKINPRQRRSRVSVGGELAGRAEEGRVQTASGPPVPGGWDAPRKVPVCILVLQRERTGKDRSSPWPHNPNTPASTPRMPGEEPTQCLGTRWDKWPGSWFWPFPLVPVAIHHC